MEREYEPGFADEIGFALMENPNIEEVCKKFGLNRKTFTEWRMLHDGFDRMVVGSLAVGRNTINEKAEAVLMEKIENGDEDISKFWLTHNHTRYIKPNSITHIRYMERSELDYVRQKDPDGKVEALLLYYSSVEEDVGAEKARKIVEPLVEFMCKQDPKLIEIFFALYRDYKVGLKEKLKLQKKVKLHTFSWEDKYEEFTS